jgi:exopolysaccharide biosynthesis protein
MLCQRSKAVACINANFFDEQHKPLGLVVSQGKMLSKMHRGGSTLTGIFQLDRSGIQILNRDNASPEKMVEAVQAGPRLISDYKPISWRGGNSNATRRSGVCIDKKNRFIMYVVASGVLGISPEELQKILSSPEVACKDALNLDGGGSSQMYFSGKVRGAPVDLKSIFVEGSDHIPVALALFQTEAGKR